MVSSYSCLENVMAPRFSILPGGSDRRNGDYSALRKASGTTRRFLRWSSLKNACRGDGVFFYISAPNSGIVAQGKVLRDPVPGRYWRYEATVGEIRMLDAPVRLDELRDLFPKWRWPNYPRGAVYLDETKTRSLLERAKRPSHGTQESMPAARRGAGFGDPETNRRVERAAIRTVARYFRKLGYAVTSRERMNCGYDLLAKNGRQERHIEVKGVQGTEVIFIITANEVKCAPRTSSSGSRS